MMGMRGTRKTGGKVHLDGEVDWLDSCGVRMMLRLEDRQGRVGSGGCGGRGVVWSAFSAELWIAREGRVQGRGEQGKIEERRRERRLLFDWRAEQGVPKGIYMAAAQPKRKKESTG